MPLPFAALAMAPSMLDKLKYIAIALLLIALVAFGVYHKIVVSALEHQVQTQATTISNLTTDNAILKTNVDSLQSAIDSQNKTIQELKNASIKASEDAKKALDMEKAKTEIWRKKYVEIWDKPMPVPGNECESIRMRLNEYFRQRQEEAKGAK